MLSGQWVFGGIDVDTKDIFMIPVQNQTAATLRPLIEQYILPGTTVHSDEWASYNLIPSTTFQHPTVNHGIDFVNTTTGVHTQTIESSWGQAKKRMRNSMTTNPELLDTHLAEICWRKKFGEASFSNLRNTESIYSSIVVITVRKLVIVLHYHCTIIQFILLIED